MKFVLIIASVCVISTVFAAPSTQSETDDVALEEFKAALKGLSEMFPGDHWLGGFVNSIEAQCLLDEYKKHNLVDMLLKPLSPSEAEELLFEHTINKHVVIFGNTALLCSNKLDPVLTFAFDVVFASSVLFDAFRHDEPIKTVLDHLVCVNNRAVKSNLIDVNSYPNLEYDLGNMTEAECDEAISEVKHMIAHELRRPMRRFDEEHKECYKTHLMSGAEKVVLKYLPLVPLKLSDEQKNIERAHFIADVRELVESLLVCHEPKTDDIPTVADNEVSHDTA
ncbi:CLUMA_CG010300, isoform A [Clunio marinus]|uniref:CLUMA_CG010300, isoform A n=1 Tax=Clunio marinus TaxID=568069 RepID=A0A1J1IAY8_9DIPT|nr:CLUMA_CG010300, isoform A [Clunio marinus]